MHIFPKLFYFPSSTFKYIFYNFVIIINLKNHYLILLLARALESSSDWETLSA